HSRERHVDAPEDGTRNIGTAEVAQCAERRLHKCIRIYPALARSGVRARGSRIGDQGVCQNLIGPLSGSSRKGVVDSGGHGLKRAREEAVARGQPPIAGDGAQSASVEFRSFQNRGEVDYMAPIQGLSAVQSARLAVTAIAAAVVHVLVR